jgi:hypothetical protein
MFAKEILHIGLQGSYFLVYQYDGFRKPAFAVNVFAIRG